MDERKYKVAIDSTVIAERVNLHIAMILAEALFEHYYNDRNMTVSVKEMERAEVIESV